MELVDGFYVDEDGNKWTASENTLESAIKKSKTLVCCKDCTDCSDCTFCKSCTLCTYCENCVLCGPCINCENCVQCGTCRDCTSCIWCTNCTWCRACNKCAWCAHCEFCTGCRRCKYCTSCTACTDCKHGESGRDWEGFYENPQRYTTPRLGSRDSQTQVYWVSPDDVRVVCGCFRGNLAEFKKAVAKTHGTNIYAVEYMEQIEIIERLVAGTKTKK